METNLQTTLAQTLAQLADFFGTTTQAVLENAPYWLSKYGWYMSIKNCICGCIFATIILGIAIIVCWIAGNAELENGAISLWHKACKYLFIGGVIIIILGIMNSIIPCIIAPEINGLTLLIQAINNN